MRVNNRYFHVFMSQKFLHCPNVISVIQQMSSKGMLERERQAARLTISALKIAYLNAF
jgi:hypothetical protein